MANVCNANDEGEKIIMAEQEWHYAKDGQRHGPITSQQLQEVATSGELQPTDLVWTEGKDEWKPASSISGLFSAGPVPPPVSASKPVGESPNPPNAQPVGIVQQLSVKFAGLDSQKKILVSVIGGASLFMFLCCGGCGLFGILGSLLNPNPQINQRGQTSLISLENVLG